jgi:hypothetical protein
MESETFNFTVINPDTQRETVIHVYSNPNSKRFAINGTIIDGQQLAELGMLMFALACQHDSPDVDSCDALLEGFEIPVPVQELIEVAYGKA